MTHVNQAGASAHIPAREAKTSPDVRGFEQSMNGWLNSFVTSELPGKDQVNIRISIRSEATEDGGRQLTISCSSSDVPQSYLDRIATRISRYASQNHITSYQRTAMIINPNA